MRWVPIVLGLVVMYVPTYINMWKYFWIREDNAHGPLIVAVVAWLRSIADEIERPALDGVGNALN